MTFKIQEVEEGKFSIEVDHGEGLTEVISNAYVQSVNVQHIPDEPTKITIELLAPSLIQPRTSVMARVADLLREVSPPSKIDEKIKLGDS